MALAEGLRFIPARAGNTAPPPRPPAGLPVHPRAGGEHYACPVTRRRRYGSSPRGRGTRTDERAERFARRFIPARAGNTAPAELEGAFVHGSSPRGRGTPFDSEEGDEQRRFIPARAGNTGRRGFVARHDAVHPRAGGEHQAPVPALLIAPGSSPRGRGTRARRPWTAPPRRFIPARAGNTRSGSASPTRAPVHPRAGGEHHPKSGRYGQGIGSSPRGRGTRSWRASRNRFRRFIPARAGNTRTRRTRNRRRTVHPRAGGEHATA